MSSILAGRSGYIPACLGLDAEEEEEEDGQSEGCTLFLRVLEAVVEVWEGRGERDVIANDGVDG
jgi:hypothetical protein